MTGDGNERGADRPAVPAKTPQVQRKKRRSKRKRPRRPMSIAAVCRAAAQEGVSYGVYVQRHGV